MKNVNTNKVVSQIKVHGTPADKTNFWFSINFTKNRWSISPTTVSISSTT